MGKRHPDKRLIQLWVHKDLLSKIDRLAEGSNRTRTDYITALIRMAGKTTVPYKPKET